MHLRIEDTLHCSQDRFWTLFFDTAWTQELLTKGLGFGEAVQEHLEETPKEIRRRMRMVPKLNLPGPVERILGSRLAVTDEGRFEREARLWRWSQRFSVLPDKLSIHGTVTTVPLGDDKCRRISNVTFEARILAVGKVIEMAAEGNIRRGFDEAAKYINAWLVRHPATATVAASTAASSPGRDA